MTTRTYVITAIIATFVGMMFVLLFTQAQTSESKASTPVETPVAPVAPVAEEEEEAEEQEVEQEVEQPYHVGLDKDANNLIQPSSIPMDATHAQLIEIIAYNTQTRAHNALTAKYSKVLKTCYLTKLRTKIMKMVAEDTEAYGTWVAKRVVLNNLKCVSLSLILPEDQADNLIELFNVKVRKLVKGRHVVDASERTVTITKKTKAEWKEIKFHERKKRELVKMRTNNMKERMKAATEEENRRKAIETKENLTYAQSQAKIKARARAKARAKAKAKTETRLEKLERELKRTKEKVRNLVGIKRRAKGKIEIVVLP